MKLTAAFMMAICVLPAEAQYETSTVAAGYYLTGIAVNPVTNKIYVANLLASNVTVIDGATNTTSTIATGPYPAAIAVNPVTNRIYVGGFQSPNVTVIDGATAATSTVAAGSNPAAIAVNPVTNKIYVANSGSSSVTVIDGVTNTTSTVAVEPDPTGFAVNPATNKIYVANENDAPSLTPDDGATSGNSTNGSVTVIDGATNTTSTIAVGDGAQLIALNPVTNKIYVATNVDSHVTIIDGATGTTSTIAVGNVFGGVVVNPVTNKIYIAGGGSEDVTVIDGLTTATSIVAESPGESASAIAVNPATNKIYAVNSLNVLVIDGATGATSTIATATGLGFVAVNQVTNKIYVGGSQSSNITVIAEPLAFTLPASPSAALVATGRTAVFNAMASGSPVPTYQWTLNGSTAIPGAATTTDPILVITGATPADMGTVTCTATNSAGAVSTSATLAVTMTSSPGYLSNLSGRGVVGSGAANALFGGFGISGAGTKQLLIRGMGPSLTLVGVPSGELTDTQLALFDATSTEIAQNSHWGGTTALAAAQGLVGAYTVPANSLDSMLYLPLTVANYSTELSGVGAATGIAVIELYDTDTPPPAARLTNVSLRAPVGAGGDILIGGFTIGGSTAETVLIRAIGPSLAFPPSVLTGVLAQPILTLFAGSDPTPLYSNAVWGGDPALVSAEAIVGAYTLSTSSQDSLLLVTLPPGGYSAEITGAYNTTGIAAVEIYEVP